MASGTTQNGVIAAGPDEWQYNGAKETMTMTMTTVKQMMN